MNCLYTTSDHTALLIYPNSNYIFLRHKTNEQIGRPTVLTKDYLSHFCSVVHDGTLYYCYQASDQRIVVKNIYQSIPLYQGDCGSDASLSQLTLLSFQDQLILFYAKHSHSMTDYSLNCLFPLKQDITITQIKRCSDRPQFATLQTPDHVLLHLSTSQKQTTYLMNHNFEFAELINHHDYETKQQYQQAALQHDWNLKSQEYQQTLEQKDSIIQRQSQMIESAKTQYQELMEVAEKYRAEALKWRGKFI